MTSNPDEIKKYTYLLESANDLILIISLKNKIEYVNIKPLFNMLGYKSKEILGKKFRSFIHPSDLDQKFNQFLIELREQRPYAEARIKHKNGEYIWIELNASIFLDIDGLKKAIVIARNINNKKLTMQKLKISENNYRKAYQELEFYKNLFAHDILNIIQNIYTSVQLIQTYDVTDILPNEIIELIQIIKDQIIHGKNLSSTIVNLSKVKDKNATIKKIEIYSYLKEVIEFIKDTFKERGILIECNTFSEEIFCYANDLIVNVFENILFNAVKHNINPIIEIAVKISKIDLEEKYYAKIEFIDNGIGIHDSRKEAIFKESWKNKETRKGLGLGLILVKKILISFKGKIWIENRIKEDYTKGCNLIIILPLVS